ncbi:MAG: hypothetical protein J07HX5_01733 [halophilic archaeon J07HX5]|nr:MAG: hypothetical protein J07HX5_01733 [halophilic archaeon J07HX5]
MLKSIGAMGIFASTFATTAATRARATPTTQTDDPLNDFDPVWRSVKETTWYEEEFYNPMWEADYPEGGISIRRVLVLNDYAGQENREGHLYEFGLFSIGVSAYAKDVDGRHISYEGIFPDGVWHSTHEITCESTDPDLFDVQERVNPTHPRVIAGISNDKITETPTTDGWIGDYTKKADLDNVSVNIRGPDVYLGTTGLGIGLMGSALSGGMAAVFAGTSYGLPAGSLIAGVSDNDTEFFEQRPDKLIYTFRDEGIGGVNDIGAFSHSVRFYISVKNHEGPRLKIGDKNRTQWERRVW